MIFKRGQESPTLHDLLSVTVLFKRDFARIRFLGVTLTACELLLMCAQAWNNFGVIPIRYWREYVIGVNT